MNPTEAALRTMPPPRETAGRYSAGTEALWSEVDRLRVDGDNLRASLRRVCNSLAIFIRENTDPGAEALAALYEAQRLL